MVQMKDKTIGRDIIHVYPGKDKYRHLFKEKCPCKPSEVLLNSETLQVIHNAFDHREFFQTNLN